MESSGISTNTNGKVLAFQREIPSKHDAPKREAWPPGKLRCSAGNNRSFLPGWNHLEATGGVLGLKN